MFAPDSLTFDLTNCGRLFIIVNMGSVHRTDRSTLVRDVALVCLADGIVGLSFGATAVAGGLPWWVPIAMSLLVFAGGSQIAAVGVVLAGGSPLAAVVAGGVLNTRLFPYGLAVADVVGSSSEAGGGAGTGGRRWWARLFGAHVITDESVAFALRQTSPEARRQAFWTCGATLFAAWNVAVALGVLAGSMIRNTNAFGLDATFPAVMLALALPTLREWRTRTAAGTGAAIAVALTPVLPAGLPVLAALGGLATIWRPRRPGGARVPGASGNPGGRPALRGAGSREPDGDTREADGAGATRESGTSGRRLDADDADGLLTGGAL
jgi:predicted branched-subunit amino acid permease